MRKRARGGRNCSNIYQRCWFAYRGEVGTSSPTCIRCGRPNPDYDADRDPRADTVSTAH